MRNRHAHYEVVRLTAEALTIRDIGPWDEHPTVTNDEAHVVAELVASGALPEGRRLFYYDSGGALDELLIVDGAFAGFRPGPRVGP